MLMTTMTFDKGPRGLFTMMGVTPERAVKELIDAGSHVVGSNCGNGIEVMTEVARKMRQATTAPILIHSNAGIPTIRKGQILYPETPEFMANWFLKLADLGINFIRPLNISRLSTVNSEALREPLLELEVDHDRSGNSRTRPDP